ncbi:MAG: right-handed parallel beta-helix repeat-containing protein, partial [Armatimonadetes bacterium]|nr:right-handed parallel beta-helix repeat-containing protein [Armatimonadota bacterium]
MFALLRVTALAAGPPVQELSFEAEVMKPFRVKVRQYETLEKVGDLPGPWQPGAWAEGAVGEAARMPDPVAMKPALRITNLEGRPSMMWKPWGDARIEGGQWQATIQYLKPGTKSAALVATIDGKETEVRLPPSRTWQTKSLRFQVPRRENNALRLTLQHYEGIGPEESLWVRSLKLEKTGGLPSMPPFVVDVSRVTGAKVDERIINLKGQTLEVGKGKAYPTLRAAWDRATENLKNRVPTRIRIHPGTYREGGFEMNAGWMAKNPNPVRETPLVIEAAKPGTVVLSGSDLFPSGEWKAVRDAQGNVLYYEHPWPHDFGFNPGGWRSHNPKLPLEHRKELAFINGKPLKQVELELYDYTPSAYDKKFPPGTKTDPFKGVPQNFEFHGVYRYKGFRNPAEALEPGTFGVAERDENGNKIFVRPAPGTDWRKALIEVGVRPFHMWFFWKDNLVLRGLTFQHGVGPIEAHGAVLIGHWHYPQTEFNNNNILVEDCTFRWNNNQCVIRYARDVTFRRNQVLYGAYGGVLTGNVHNLLWEDVETSFNNWRVYGGWSSGPVKIHQTQDAVFRNHTSIGNNGTGLWYDITCGNVLVDRAVLFRNHQGLDWEISRGLLVRDSLIAMNERGNFVSPTGMDMTVENSIFYGVNDVGQFYFEAGERDSGPEIMQMMGREPIPFYTLGPLTVRDSVIASADDSPLFFQEHGNPYWYPEFLKERLHLHDNVWHATSKNVFGTAKIYGTDWQKKPPRNT